MAAHHNPAWNSPIVPPPPHWPAGSLEKIRHPIMPHMEFSYEEIALNPSAAFPSGHTALRPTITVALQLGDKRTDPPPGLVDSGADYCIFPPECAESLGLDYVSFPTETAYGIGEDQQIRFGRVVLEVVGFGAWEIYAGFSESWRGRGFAMLGQLGLFDRFKITFDAQRRRFEVVP